MRSVRNLGLILFTLISIEAFASSSCIEGLISDRRVVTNVELQTRVAQMHPQVFTFIKDAPLVGYRITSPEFNDIPPEIRNHIGSEDQTTYDRQFMIDNQGTVVALQLKDGTTPDYYIIGLNMYRENYRDVAYNEVAEKNARYFGRLQGQLPQIQNPDPHYVAILKTTPVQMIRMSEIGYNTGNTVTIESPWGEQTKPAGQDAYLAHDVGHHKLYMINTDANGTPINYMPQ